ncbi:hypothetical protein EKN51_11255 [Enterobacter hormaechei]|uniref:hypothetical protein n=1 Tax=Enterobacter hormaechei TaxID=158836 RepID=UPI000F82290B|nr:hypothetical protein [Enterobacter hormaechei]RTP15594.1 hypothetical protein EKN51_11255 [Enterobacter hormaechei]
MKSFVKFRDETIKEEDHTPESAFVKLHTNWDVDSIRFEDSQTNDEFNNLQKLYKTKLSDILNEAHQEAVNQYMQKLI